MDSPISQHMLCLRARASTQCVSDRAQAFETLASSEASQHTSLRPHELESKLSVPIEQWLPGAVGAE